MSHHHDHEEMLAIGKDRARSKAAIISLAVGLLLMVLKFWAFRVSNSQAVLSDALESIINVMAAGMALFVIYYSAQPADKEHPYGHGKAEYFSSAFEGGLISFAGIFIVIEGLSSLYQGHELRQLDFGLKIVAGAGVANLLLGLYLIYAGNKNSSIALRASGHHVISDFWTSLGIIIALLLVKVTGLVWIDSAVAVAVGGYLSYTGFKIFRESLSGLMDEEDPELLKQLTEIMDRRANGKIIQVHHFRMIRSGRYHHIDAHLVVPEFWDINKAHNEMVGFEKRVISEYPFDGDMNLHLDPCRRVYCSVCELKDCPIREKPFKEKRPFSVEELRAPDEPEDYRDPDHPG